MIRDLRVGLKNFQCEKKKLLSCIFNLEAHRKPVKGWCLFYSSRRYLEQDWYNYFNFPIQFHLSMRLPLWRRAVLFHAVRKPLLGKLVSIRIKVFGGIILD